LLKIGVKSFRDGSHDICKDTESNLGPFAGFQGWNYPEASFVSVFVLNNSRRIITSSSQLCSLLSFSFVLVSSPPRSFFCLNHIKFGKDVPIQQCRTLALAHSPRRVQILDHSPIWRVQFSSPRNYLRIKIKNDFTLHFGKKIPKYKLTISTLQSFVFRKASDVHVLHSAKQYGLPPAIIT